MPLVTIVITLGVVGVLLWLVNSFIPMQGQIKGILNGVVVIAVVLWLLKIFGMLGHPPSTVWGICRVSDGAGKRDFAQADRVTAA